MDKKNFTDLQTVDGEKDPHNSYKDICLHLGLLRDDGEWKMALDEALARDSARAIRGLHSHVVRASQPCRPVQ